MKKIISSLLISISIASCGYNPMPTSVSMMDNTGNYILNVGQKQNGATISAKIKLSNSFKTKGLNTNVHGKPVKTLSDVRYVEVYLLALDASYSGTDPLSDKSAIVNTSGSLSFSYNPDLDGFFGVKFTNVGETPTGKVYYIGVVAKDISNNVISKDGGAWTGTSLDSGLNLSTSSLTVSNLLQVSSTSPLEASLTLKDSVGAEIAGNITPMNGLIQAYGSDMLGFSTIAGGGLAPFGPSNVLATDNALTANIRGIATDSSGNAYFADESSGYIAMVNKSGLMSVIATGLDTPVGLSVNENGDIIVVENGVTKKVTKFAKQSLGVYTKTSYNISSASDISGGVYSVALSNINPNIVYVGTLPTITKLDMSTGTFTDLIVNFGDTGGIAVDSNDNLYISDFAGGNAGQGKIIKYNPNTDTTTTIATGLNSPDGMGVTHSGAIFVVTDGNKIYKYKQNSSGTWSKDLFAGGGTLPGNSNGTLSNQAQIGSIEMLAVETGKTLSGAPTLYYVDKTAMLVRKLVTSREPARRIVFSSNNDILAIDSDGENLVEIDTLNENYDPSWSPNGKKVAYSTYDVSSSDITISNDDGSSHVTINMASGLYAYSPIWSPDGTKILYTVDNNNTNKTTLYVYDTMTTNSTDLTPTISTLDESLRNASWSPDGTKIAYSFRNEIYIMNSDGTNRVRLTDDTYSFSNPKFSPDGTKILVQSYDSNDEDLFVLNSDGTGSPLNLTGDISVNNLNYASWSPDGTKIAYEVDMNVDDDIYIMDSDGGNKTQLTDNDVNDYDPEFSPDGNKILFISDGYLYTMNIDGSSVSQVSNKPASEPKWSPI